MTPGGRWRAWVLAGLVTVTAGCSTAVPTPTPTPTAPTTAPAATPTAVDPSTAGGDAATPLPPIAAPVAVPLDVVTLVCESWGSEPPPGTIPCRDAAALALTALGPRAAAAVARLDVGFGDACPALRSCPNRQSDAGWVLARLDAREGGLIRVARDPKGDLRVWPPETSPLPPVPTFTAPPPAAPPLGPDAPSALGDREPYPFCGDEDVGPSQSFDVAARRCFVDGVYAGSPVELISRSASTEGDALVTLYRFGGMGSVFRAIRANGSWTFGVCAITPLDTPAAFAISGGCDPANP